MLAVEEVGRAGIRTRFTQEPWTLDVDAIVLSLGPRNRAGGLLRAMQAEAGPDARKAIERFLNDASAPLTARSPVVLDGLDDGKRLVMATASIDGEALQSLEGVRVAVAAIMDAVRSPLEGRRVRVALPLLGAGAAGLEARLAARATLEAIDGARGPVDVTLFTDSALQHEMIELELRAHSGSSEQAQNQREPEISSLLSQVIRRAGILGQAPGQPELASFHSLFVALLIGPEPELDWVRLLASDLGLDMRLVFDRWAQQGFAVTTEALTRAAEPTQLTPTPTPTFSTSAAHAVQNARSLALEANDPEIDVEHLLAGFILKPGNHAEDLKAWNLNRHAWAGRLTTRIQRQRPHLLRAFVQLHDRELPFSIANSAAVALAHARNLAGANPVGLSDLLAGILRSRDTDDGITGKWLASTFPSLVGAEVEAQLPNTSSDTYVAWFGASRKADLSPLATEVMERARLFAARQDVIYVWHLLAGLLCTAGAEADLLWERPGIDRIAVLRSLRALVHRDDRAEAKYWATLLDVDPGRSFAGYSNDSASGTKVEDYLGFRRSADALAAVLNARQTDPPLSVGVFGKWGSGKSFFLNLLREAVRDSALAEMAHRQKYSDHSEGLGGCAKVVQIEFNAWQYMDANLWASLTTHIFNELNRELGGTEKAPTAATYVKQLESVRGEIDELQARKGPLDAKITELNARIKNTVPDLAQALRGNQAVVTALEALQEHLGINTAGEPAKVLRDQARKLASLAGRIGAWFRLVRHNWTSIITVAAVAVVPFLLTKLTSLIPRNVGLGASVCLPLATILRQIVTRVNPIVDKVDDAVAEAREVDVRERDRVQQQLSSIQAQLATLQQRKAEIEGEIVALQSGASFAKFVLQRAQSNDYRSQLGAISMASADLRQLAEKLIQKGEPHLERIILYIDDLDRCPPARVVEVLQAVHLLLALPLFVVVVAVDPRWLLASLEAHYSSQFGEDRSEWEATPQHYLEKIFQMSFAVPSMRRDFVMRMLGRLLARDMDSPALPPRTPPPVSTIADSAPKDDRSLAPTSVGAPFSTIAAIEQGVPSLLRLTAQELENLQSLAQLVETPRGLKRLANTYRFARATVPAEKVTEFVAVQYRLAQTLLAMNIGNPQGASGFFASLLDRDPLDHATLHDLLAKHADDTTWWQLVRAAFARLETTSGRANAEIVRFVAQFGFDSALRPRTKTKVTTASSS